MARSLEQQVDMSEIPTAIVTGASRGIGAAIAVALAGAGYRIAAVGRDIATLDETLACCMAKGPGGEAFEADLTRLEDIPALVDQIATRFGRIDVLINNAGENGGGKILEAELERWDSCIRTNVLAVMHLTHAVATHLVKRPRSALITIGSIASRISYSGGGAYVASKHAALGFTSCMFEDLREHGVKVSTICPGFVDTTMVTSANIDRHKMIAPADVAAAVLYILTASDRVCPTEIVLRPQKSPYV